MKRRAEPVSSGDSQDRRVLVSLLKNRGLLYLWKSVDALAAPDFAVLLHITFDIFS
jgi:hypothetical protein